MWEVNLHNDNVLHLVCVGNIHKRQNKSSVNCRRKREAFFSCVLRPMEQNTDHSRLNWQPERLGMNKFHAVANTNLCSELFLLRSWWINLMVRKHGFLQKESTDGYYVALVNFRSMVQFETRGAIKHRKQIWPFRKLWRFWIHFNNTSCWKFSNEHNRIKTLIVLWYYIILPTK